MLQEVTKRLPGRLAGYTAYASAADLAQAMTRAAEAHRRHEKRIGQADPNWPAWYAGFMTREQSDEELPENAANGCDPKPPSYLPEAK